jgi:DASS family divalent anion:Na+ symporter
MSDSTKKHFKLVACVLLGAVLWPMSGWFDVDPKGWHVFSVFMAVILSFILRPYPMGMNVLFGLLVLLGSGTLTLKQSLSGFSDTTVWLVIAAFLLAGAILKTGFGTRMALWLVTRLGKSMKGLGYAICSSEFLLGSVIPSNTARGGGIHAPIVDSLAHSIDSSSKTSTRAGSYLSLVGSHANLIAASMYMTGMAANPLVSKAAKDIFNIDFTWSTWLLGSIIPAIVSFMLLPHLIYWLSPPEVQDSSAAREGAIKKLKARSSMKRNEKIMMVVLIGLLVLWSTQFWHGLSTTFIAWLGVAVLLILNAYSWDDLIQNAKAWETLFWLGGLLTMASMLSEYGFIQWFVDQSKNAVIGVSGLTIILILGLIYFYSMYAFSMLSGHIAAMVAPFFAVCLAAEVQPMIAIAVFAYFSCLCGCTTNYSSGPVIIYFGLGHVKAPHWFRIGFIISIAHIIIWLGVGLVWWKVIGWW